MGVRLLALRVQTVGVMDARLWANMGKRYRRCLTEAMKSRAVEAVQRMEPETGAAILVFSSRLLFHLLVSASEALTIFTRRCAIQTQVPLGKSWPCHMLTQTGDGMENIAADWGHRAVVSMQSPSSLTVGSDTVNSRLSLPPEYNARTRNR